MNKQECVNEITNITGLSKRDCKLCLNAVLEIISDALKQGESVTLSNFGKFKLNETKPKNIYDFKTGQTKKVESKRVPSFKASAQLKQVVK